MWLLCRLHETGFNPCLSRSSLSRRFKKDTFSNASQTSSPTTVLPVSASSRVVDSDSHPDLPDASNFPTASTRSNTCLQHISKRTFEMLKNTTPIPASLQTISIMDDNFSSSLCGTWAVTSTGFRHEPASGTKGDNAAWLFAESSGRLMPNVSQ